MDANEEYFIRIFMQSCKDIYEGSAPHAIPQFIRKISTSGHMQRELAREIFKNTKLVELVLEDYSQDKQRPLTTLLTELLVFHEPGFVNIVRKHVNFLEWIHPECFAALGLLASRCKPTWAKAFYASAAVDKMFESQMDNFRPDKFVEMACALIKVSERAPKVRPKKRFLRGLAKLVEVMFQKLPKASNFSTQDSELVAVFGIMGTVVKLYPEAPIPRKIRRYLHRNFGRDSTYSEIKGRDMHLLQFNESTCAANGCNTLYTNKFKVCAHCESVFYCSKECAKIHKVEHEQFCKRILKKLGS